MNLLALPCTFSNLHAAVNTWYSIQTLQLCSRKRGARSRGWITIQRRKCSFPSSPLSLSLSLPLPSPFWIMTPLCSRSSVWNLYVSDALHNQPNLRFVIAIDVLFCFVFVMGRFRHNVAQFLFRFKCLQQSAFRFRSTSTIPAFAHDKNPHARQTRPTFLIISAQRKIMIRSVIQRVTSHGGFMQLRNQLIQLQYVMIFNSSMNQISITDALLLRLRAPLLASCAPRSFHARTSYTCRTFMHFRTFSCIIIYFANMLSYAPRTPPCDCLRFHTPSYAFMLPRTSSCTFMLVPN